VIEGSRLTPGLSRTRLRIAALLGTAILSGCLSQSVVPGDRGADPFAGLARRGWRIAEPVRVFTPESLYEEIDGEAELYLPYSFRDLRVAILTPDDRPAAQLRLELYRHGNSRDAYGIYSQYRFPGQETIRVGSSEAILSDASLDFFRGESFVRLRAASREATRDDLQRLGRDLAKLLPGTGAFPRETEVLRLPGSAQGPVAFHRRAGLGYEALAPCFEARIDDGKISGRLLLLTGEDVGSSSALYEKLRRELPGFSREGRGYSRASLASGTLWLLSRERYHLGFAGKATREQAEGILTELDNRASLILRKRETR